jgi:hypothetical protein
MGSAAEGNIWRTGGEEGVPEVPPPEVPPVQAARVARQSAAARYRHENVGVGAMFLDKAEFGLIWTNRIPISERCRKGNRVFCFYAAANNAASSISIGRFGESSSKSFALLGLERRKGTKSAEANCR